MINLNLNTTGGQGGAGTTGLRDTGSSNAPTGLDAFCANPDLRLRVPRRGDWRTHHCLTVKTSPRQLMLSVNQKLLVIYRHRGSEFRVEICLKICQICLIS